jgi:hypothetical protein
MVDTGNPRMESTKPTSTRLEIRYFFICWLLGIKVFFFLLLSVFDCYAEIYKVIPNVARDRL